MKYITRRQVATNIISANKKSSNIFKKFTLVFSLFMSGHFALAYYLLNKFLPLMPIFTNPQSSIQLILGGCLVLYPILYVYELKRAKRIFNRSVIASKEVLDSVAQDMEVMGLDVSLENLLSADVQLIEHESKLVGISEYRGYEEALIKIKNRKDKLLFLRECTTLIQKYAYQDPEVDTIVHLIDEEEYQEVINKRELTKE